MVGFIGTQFRLSSADIGALVSSYEVFTLADGRVIAAVMRSNFGSVEFWEGDPAGGPPTFLNSYAVPSSGGFAAVQALSPFALGDGFGMVSASTPGSPITGGLATFQRFSADGVAEGAPVTIDSGFLGDVKAFGLPEGGFIVRYYDRRTDGEQGGDRVVSFRDADGDERARVLLEPGSTFSGVGIPEVAVLANGNVALAWSTQSDDIRTQVFRPNGSEVGPAVTFPGSRGGFDDVAIAALKGGGYVTVARTDADQSVFELRRFTNTGTADGAPVVLPTKIDGAGGYVGGRFEAAVTKEGLIAIVWDGADLASASLRDVYVALVSPGGEIVFGPAVMNALRPDTQDDVQIDRLPDGRLIVSFNDDTNVIFSFQASVQSAFIEEPDFFFEGTARADTRNGTGGDDVLLGLGGNDRLGGLDGADYVRGGEGNDTITGGAGGDDLLGDAGRDRIDGGDGADTITGGSDDDDLTGGNGGDVIAGGTGNDTASGGAGDDSVDGGEGNDDLKGDAGDDRLLGAAGRDTLRGGTGNDSLEGGDDADDLRGDAGNDTLEGKTGNDVLRGGGGNDNLQGDEGNDTLVGDAGNDILNGGAGNDRQNGGAGNDIIVDNDGNDRITGGSGADTFEFQDTDFGKDRITDFEFGVDTLDMGITARSLALAGERAIQVQEVTGGVRFLVDRANWVLVEGATLADFQPGDFIVTDPFG